MTSGYFKFPLSLALISLFLLPACKNNESDDDSRQKTEQKTVAIDKPSFNEDTTYQFIADQVKLGPRVPGTPAQQQCANWMHDKLKMFTDTVYRQETQVKGGDGKSLRCINLVGTIHPAAKRRVLLLAQG